MAAVATVKTLFICGGSRPWGASPLHTDALVTQMLDSRFPGTRQARVLNSTRSRDFPSSSIWGWVCGGPASGLGPEGDGRRQSLWPSSGGLSWPKRDRYSSVLEDKRNKLVNALVNFSRLKKNQEAGKYPSLILPLETQPHN